MLKKTINCKACGAIVGRNAPSCPQCGEELIDKNENVALKGFLIFFCLAAIATYLEKLF